MRRPPLRPIKLEVQGLTAFKQKAEIDFTGLDLFAITGPTGAGKTTLVDAITYALFGKIPRVSDDIKQLISQGEQHLHVNLEFSSNGQSYRIHRSTGHKGTPTVQLERLDATGEWVPETERSREATQYIERILGMDYEGFVRSILLPQGQFQQFLAGKPEERRKVLDGLLRLDIYGQMLQKANQVVAENTSNADNVQRILDTEYADATPEALRKAKQELKEARALYDGLRESQEAVAAALKTAERVSLAMAQRADAEDELKKAERALQNAQSTLKGGTEKVDALKTKLETMEKQIDSNPYDEQAHDRAKHALMSAQELKKEEKDLTDFDEQIARCEQAIETARLKVDTATAAAAAAKSAAAEAKSRHDELRRRNAAIVVRQGIAEGDPCPVCGQKVGALPKEKHTPLDGARKAMDAAQKKAEVAGKDTQEAARAADRAAVTLESTAKQRTKLAADVDAHRKSLAELLGGETPSPTQIKTGVDEQTALRDQRRKTEADARALRMQLDDISSGLVDAKTTVAKAETVADAAKKRIGDGDKTIADGRQLLSSVAANNDWPDVTEKLREEIDVAPLLRRRDKDIDDALGETNQQIGATDANVKRITEGIKRAKDLRAQQKEARAAASLAKDLASVLKVTAFPNYIRERALKVLARDGSARLLKISNERYEFRVARQEFMVEDGWNLGETRSVKTLSGGETFLASLALALALAETLPTLGAGARADTLECLLIDEGFSNLDRSTLDAVVNALEIIGKDRTRMVGIVTHLDELAERMPSRIRVQKDRSNSTVTIE